MYDTCIFKGNEKLLKWAMDYTCASKRTKRCVGWDGEMNYVHMSKNLMLLYQLAKMPEGLEVVKLHMLLWSERRSLRRDVFKVSKLFKPEGEVMWHSAIEYEGRADMPFLAVNAWMEGEFEKYSEGGCFEISFSGIGCNLECTNDKGTIRFYDGAPLEIRRKEENDPTIDHADMYTTELRMLNSWHEEDGGDPAGAEFAGIVEGCRTETICGEKCYLINLWSGPVSSPASFPWTLLVAANRVEGHYVPRVGDMVHGSAFMFGTFFGENHDKPSVFHENFTPVAEGGDESPMAQDGESGTNVEGKFTDDGNEDVVTDSNAKPSKSKDGWEWLPRKPEEYPVFKSYGGGLTKSVATVLPKYVVYTDYRKKIKGELKPLKALSRKALKRILDSIDYVIPNKNNLYMFGSVMDSIGIRHFLVDIKTGERHLWCCVPSGFGREHFRSNLLVALDEAGEVVRYTFYMGDWSGNRLYRGMDLSINFQSSEKQRNYDSIGALVKGIGKMVKDDYVIASCLGHTSMVQAYCTDVVDGVQQFTIEWQIHYLPWQFYIQKGTRQQLVDMLKEFDANGIEPVETMARWKWCKMKGNT